MLTVLADAKIIVRKLVVEENPVALGIIWKVVLLAQEPDLSTLKLLILYKSIKSDMQVGIEIGLSILLKVALALV